ncbi:STAS/SEC14 domain-containing protein [Desulfospira joergensenii]|uniref:STAS/SEC14 domain-containing protein n=1 Tax=Desulfospira joergensenii TaxID=53329 RepID=UPI0003B3979B|nr:STAS/SEC14 domain-containing protein [Desulfospira joergensenii]
MLEIVDIGVEDAIAYRVGAKFTKDEMNEVLSLFQEKIDKGEKLIVYQEIAGFGKIEPGALLEKMKFFNKAGLSHFSRVALVTQEKWVKQIADLEGRLFTSFQMKGFPMEEKDQAIEFLRKENQ